jgi:hypothetical protein
MHGRGGRGRGDWRKCMERRLVDFGIYYLLSERTHIYISTYQE